MKWLKSPFTRASIDYKNQIMTINDDDGIIVFDGTLYDLIDELKEGQELKEKLNGN